MNFILPFIILGAPLYEPLRDADGNEDLSLFFQVMC